MPYRSSHKPQCSK